MESDGLYDFLRKADREGKRMVKFTKERDQNREMKSNKKTDHAETVATNLQREVKQNKLDLSNH